MTELSAVCQRKALLGKSIITLDDASKAGTINEIWVDAKTRRVVALGCQAKGRNTNLAVPIEHIQVLGDDAVLIPSVTSLLDEVGDTWTRFVDHEIVTEGGKRIGQVDDYYFERTGGEITNCLLSAGGISSFLEGHTRLDGAELVVIGKERSIAKIGAEERLVQVDKGLQQWVEVGRTKVKETTAKVQETAASIQERITASQKKEPEALPAAPVEPTVEVVDTEPTA
jgi:uncharacterized protein YrrD